MLTKPKSGELILFAMVDFGDVPLRGLRWSLDGAKICKIFGDSGQEISLKYAKATPRTR